MTRASMREVATLAGAVAVGGAAFVGIIVWDEWGMTEAPEMDAYQVRDCAAVSIALQRYLDGLTPSERPPQEEYDEITRRASQAWYRINRASFREENPDPGPWQETLSAAEDFRDIRVSDGEADIWYADSIAALRACTDDPGPAE